MSPYILTTLEPDPEDIARGCEMVSTRESRRAFATVAEVLQELRRIAYAHNTWLDNDTLLAVPESGGTVGPLPDGTVIEVAPVTLAALAGSPVAQYNTRHTAEIIDAYNEAQDA